MYCNWGNKEVELTLTPKLVYKRGRIIRECDDKAIRECDYPLCVKRHDTECLRNKLIYT